MSTYDEFEDRSESLALLEEEMMKYLLIEAVNAKKAEVFENVVFEGKRRYYIEDLSVRDYTLENTTPYQLQLFDTVIEETSWGELLRKVSLFLLERFPEHMDTITDFRCQWTKQVMYSREKKTNYKVLTEELFINVNHTALHSCWFLQDLLDYFKVDRATVRFLIHRPSGAEPGNVKEYILNRSKKDFIVYLKENHQLTEEAAQSIVNLIDKHLNPLLCKVSKSYTNFFLFDSNTTLYNYVKRVKEKILASGYEEKAKKLLLAVLEYIVKYYKS